MTLQQIMYFQQVARSGSFTKAARACFVSQTAISRQICALEEELHVTLLERDTAHVKLTLAGEYFFQQVNELTARLEEVVTRTQTIAQEQQTVDLYAGTEATLGVRGRHDPCIVPRAVPCVEAAAAVTLLDLLLEG